MSRTALVLAVVPLLASCDMHAKKPAHGDSNVMINADESGNVAFNLPFMSGSVKLPEGALQKGEFDIDGVKMMPGGQITGFNVNATDKKGGIVNLAFKAPASPEQVRAYFLDQFKAKGLEASASGDGVTGKTKDGEPFTIHVAQADQGSTGTIEIQSKN